ncbi:unnamed protein product [Heligmosomoides polygyrus]|uniref:Col_cuticle_N domain-containing protein n=1 Tax=Heligmosomoides polygyrus TaxID=6339 RepID=A0A183FA94_HELPZ|nr:unnamed protein product [Heligmosomoides polygyrus]
MLRINFDVTSYACAIFAGSAYVMVILLVPVRIALALFAEGTTIVSSAGQQSVETDLTALPSKNTQPKSRTTHSRTLQTSIAGKVLVAKFITRRPSFTTLPLKQW